MNCGIELPQTCYCICEMKKSNGENIPIFILFHLFLIILLKIFLLMKFLYQNYIFVKVNYDVDNLPYLYNNYKLFFYSFL